MKLGLLLKLYRMELELTVRDLGAQIGVSHGTISRIENGESISAETLMKILNWLFEEAREA